MGFYDVSCGLSGLSLLGQDCDAFLLRNTRRGWSPICFGVRGNYNRYGSIDSFRDAGIVKAISLALKSLSLTVDWSYRGNPADRRKGERSCDLEQFLMVAERTHGNDPDAVTFEGDSLGFMLVQANVADAVVETVETSSDRAFAKLKRAALTKLDLPALAVAAFGNTEPGPTLVAALTPASSVRAQLVRTIQLRGWVDTHGKWTPDFDCGSQHDEARVAKAIARAHKRFQKWPLLVAAVDAARRNYPFEPPSPTGATTVKPAKRRRGPRRFEIVDNGVTRFWSIEIGQRSHLVHSGRIARASHVKTTMFKNRELAREDAARLIAAKIKKGYVECK